ncbi:unnamed protein product [Didymodactylos carnosus]|uniref:Reverse transcriptase domain-containing protein n=1 Tax=Didymodactylos carnosus TaxID=1234261 RepID=A0A815MZ64_9BILA|nr:unnamed protein product [Didymodactylos carnosus]CAF4307803.1 unnamed protein product [Didymodactylos carnosus]
MACYLDWSQKNHDHKSTTWCPCGASKDELLPLLYRFQAIFDTTKYNIGKTPINNIINTILHSPPACQPYPQPRHEEALYNIIQEFLKAGLITKSAPAILVDEGDGKKRLLVDFKKLNRVTIKDSSPMPNMKETIRKLGKGYKYLSKLDLKSGFYQILVFEGGGQEGPK